MRALIKPSCAPKAAVPAHGEHQKQQLTRSGKKLQHPPTQPTQVSELQNPKNIGHSCFRSTRDAHHSCSPVLLQQHFLWLLPSQSSRASHITPSPPALNPPRNDALASQGPCRNDATSATLFLASSMFIYSLPCILCLQIFLLAGGIPREGCSSPCGSLLFCLFLSHTELLFESKLTLLCLHKGTLQEPGRGSKNSFSGTTMSSKSCLDWFSPFDSYRASPGRQTNTAVSLTQYSKVKMSFALLYNHLMGVLW